METIWKNQRKQRHLPLPPSPMAVLRARLRKGGSMLPISRGRHFVADGLIWFKKHMKSMNSNYFNMFQPGHFEDCFLYSLFAPNLGKRTWPVDDGVGHTPVGDPF